MYSCNTIWHLILNRETSVSITLSIVITNKYYFPFQLSLTTNVSVADYNMGYAMTGSLERGYKKDNLFQMTHFAVIRRYDFDKS